VKKTKKYKTSEQQEFLETPAGIFTKNGVWFHTTLKSLNEFAGELFKRIPLNTLFEKAEQWIKSTDTFGIIISLICLLLLPIHFALPLTLGLSWLFDSFRPTFFSIPLSNLISILNKEFITVTLAVIPLSWFGMSGQYLTLLFGIILFLIFKFGWMRALFETVRRDTGIPMNDRILHMIINKYAIREGITTLSTALIEQRLTKAIETSSKQRSKLFK